MSKILDVRVSPAKIGSSVEGRTAVGGNLASGAAADTELAWPAPSLLLPPPCTAKATLMVGLHNACVCTWLDK